ncbi:MAG: 4Fe-4S dicluster domain-containing protein [Dethiobacteria bacterium]|nr:4Fe-4S dicluster domain-containing protein [Dethiobacteria bacterium]
MAERNLEQTVKVREAVAQDLLGGRINLLLGWEKGHYWWQSRPLFARTEKDLEKLVWDSFCVVNLSRYLLDELKDHDKIGVLVKGCDARAFNRLLQDHMVPRDRVVLYGLPCPGMLDHEKMLAEAAGEVISISEENGQVILKTAAGDKRAERAALLMDKCTGCVCPDPVVYDQLLFSPQGEKQVPERFKAVEELENLSSDERFAYWEKELSRCLRCYACRQACPYCSCRECFVEQENPRWQGRAYQPSENFLFHLVRAYHGAGRCIDCGECERSCPVGIPLQELNRKLIKDINELYGDYEAGLSAELEPPLLTYRPDDPAAFSEK